jgi:hypothetical protein
LFQKHFLSARMLQLTDTNYVNFITLELLIPPT